MAKTRQVLVPINRVVSITANHGGYTGGVCAACGNSGWVTGDYGYPSRMREKALGNQLIHKPSCPMNEHVGDDGYLKKK